MGNTFTPTSGYITPVGSITDIQNVQDIIYTRGAGLPQPPKRSLPLPWIRLKDKPGFGASVCIVASTLRPVRVDHNYGCIYDLGLSVNTTNIAGKTPDSTQTTAYTTYVSDITAARGMETGGGSGQWWFWAAMAETLPTIQQTRKTPSAAAAGGGGGGLVVVVAVFAAEGRMGGELPVVVVRR